MRPPPRRRPCTGPGPPAIEGGEKGMAAARLRAELADAGSLLPTRRRQLPDCSTALAAVTPSMARACREGRLPPTSALSCAPRAALTGEDFSFLAAKRNFGFGDPTRPPSSLLYGTSARTMSSGTISGSPESCERRVALMRAKSGAVRNAHRRKRRARPEASATRLTGSSTEAKYSKSFSGLAKRRSRFSYSPGGRRKRRGRSQTPQQFQTCDCPAQGNLGCHPARRNWARAL